MTDLEMERKIREAFEDRHMPSPLLESRVIASLPWRQAPERRRAISSSAPRLAGVFAGLLAFALIAVIAGPPIVARLTTLAAGRNVPPAGSPGYSLAAVTGDSVFIVQRGPDGNVLLQSTDNGTTWQPRVSFGGVYAGSQMLGESGFVWSIDMGMSTNCKPVTCAPPTLAMTLYRSTDGGVSWTALPATQFPVEDVFFLDREHGWADSASPTQGPAHEVLFATSDAGVTWTRVGPLPEDSPNGYGYGLGNYRVTFSRDLDGSLRGWYLGAAKLYTSTDAGSSWRAVQLPVPAPVMGWTASPQQPAFNGRAGMIAVAFHDPTGADNATPNAFYLYASGDGGATWGAPVPGPAGFGPVGDILSTAILDAQYVWLTSQSVSAGDSVQASPAVARTSDGGHSWQVARSTPRILEMRFRDPLQGYGLDVSGTYNVNGIVRTTDGGATWQRLNLPIFPAVT